MYDLFNTKIKYQTCHCHKSGKISFILIFCYIPIMSRAREIYISAPFPPVQRSTCERALTSICALYKVPAPRSAGIDFEFSSHLNFS